MKKYLLTWLLIMLTTLVTQQVVLAAPATQRGGEVHYVIFGENLSSIAAQYGVSVEAILRYNGLANPNLIYVGQPLLIPVPAYNGGGYKSCSNYYTVRRGDTLYSIALAYGTTVNELLRLNNLYDANLIQAGQAICVPMSYNQPTYDGDYNAPPTQGYYHKVVQGETLSGICQYYRVNIYDVIEINHLDSSGMIYIGQQLFIPGYDGSDFIPRPPSPLPIATPKPPVVVVQPTATPTKSCGCDKPDCSCPPPPPQPIDVYLRLGRNVAYENWGRPLYGLNDCSNSGYDDGHPVKRLTIEVILTNHSKMIIPREWADPDNVILHTAQGAEQAACKHLRADSTYPLDLKPDQTIDVTFYSHLEPQDFVTVMEFTELGICFDPNSGDQVPCSFK